MSRDPRDCMPMAHWNDGCGGGVMRLTLRGLRGFREGCGEPSRDEYRNWFKGMRRGLRGLRGLAHAS